MYLITIHRCFQPLQTIAAYCSFHFDLSPQVSRATGDAQKTRLPFFRSERRHWLRLFAEVFLYQFYSWGNKYELLKASVSVSEVT